MGTQSFYPFGEVRTGTGIFDTERGFTGQIFDAGTGLNFYNARYQDPVLGRFISPDSIVPNPQNPKHFNRFSYVNSNPLKYVDPTGNVCSFAGENDDCPLIADYDTDDLVGDYEFSIQSVYCSDCIDQYLATEYSFHTTLDIVGFVPGIGEVADAVNAGLYALEGDLTNAAISAAALVPVAGSLGTGGRLVAGGAAPVLKGRQGVDDALEILQSQGHVVRGTEVIIDTAAGTRRYDAVLADPTGKIYALEVKTGPQSRYTRTQRAKDAALENSGGVGRGQQAERAGLSGQTGPMPVQLIQVNTKYWYSAS